MLHWRAELAARFNTSPTAEGDCRWPRTGIQPFQFTEGARTWRIDELLTDKELRREGAVMRHCVATYIRDCARRKTSIWSMKLHDGKLHHRVLTIEVLPYLRQIWQAKGKRNTAPSAEARQILNRWAAQEGLAFRAGATA